MKVKEILQKEPNCQVVELNYIDSEGEKDFASLSQINNIKKLQEIDCSYIVYTVDEYVQKYARDYDMTEDQFYRECIENYGWEDDDRILVMDDYRLDD